MPHDPPRDLNPCGLTWADFNAFVVQVIRQFPELGEPAQHDGPWWAGMVECWLCGHRSAVVIPIEHGQVEPTVRMECGKCHNLTAVPLARDPEAP